MTINAHLTNLLSIDLPIIQAPMAGAQGWELAAAVSNAGGLGSIPCSIRSVEQVFSEVSAFRAACKKPLNLNFFCHHHPEPDEPRQKMWQAEFAEIYALHNIDPTIEANVSIHSFDDAMCKVIETVNPEIVSFHFGLPEQKLFDRVKASGAKIISTATTLDEAEFLVQRGCDAIIAQGIEAGGHRGMFLSPDPDTQSGLFSLISKLVDSVDAPIIAAGGIADGRGIAAALVLGASAVQIGTRYLKTHEATIEDAHRKILLSDEQPDTVITNVFTGRPARSFINKVIREVGPIATAAPRFPLAAGALSPLKKVTSGSSDFIPLWAGQSAHIGNAMGAGELTKELANDMRKHLGKDICQNNHT